MFPAEPRPPESAPSATRVLRWYSVSVVSVSAYKQEQNQELKRAEERGQCSTKDSTRDPKIAAEHILLFEASKP